MKRLVVCCDGTWQNLTRPYPTNVVKIAQAIKPSDGEGVPQIMFYIEGIGTGYDVNVAEGQEDHKFLNDIDKLRGGAFGFGIDNNIQDAYRFLCLNYEAGDEIYLFGFSRGAYTARSLVGLIRCAGGLLKRNKIREAPDVYQLYRDYSLTLKEKERLRTVPKAAPKGSLFTNEEPDDVIYANCRARAYQIYGDRSRVSLEAAYQSPELAREDLAIKDWQVDQLLQDDQITRLDDQDRQPAQITLLGCWDTVGSLGVPNQIPWISDWANAKYRFHDTVLSNIVDNALHAVAIDEIRSVFELTPMQQKHPKPEHQTLRQVWFPGGHGCVGGGTRSERGLSDATLEWMIEQVGELGLKLEFDKTAVEDGICPDHTTPFDNRLKGIFNLTGERPRDIVGISDQAIPQIHASVRQRWLHQFTEAYRPVNLQACFERYPQMLQGWADRVMAIAEDMVQDIVQDIEREA
jgi:uncharacterized protein (DUF2235 family)